MKSLKNKNILIGISGSIAAYKACDIIRYLKKNGCNVQAIMTASAQQFIGKTTIAALTNNSVIDSVFNENPKPGLEHINLAFDIDIIVVIPATANILAKAANGIADDALSLALSICEQPTVFCPAMNFKMWRSAANIQAVTTLRKRKKIVVDPEEGFLASLHTGRGRLAGIQSILNGIQASLDIELPLRGKQVVVTAGPTQEPIDRVRYISNRSSGKMGFAIAQCAHELGAKVTLITGPTNQPPIPSVDTINIKTAEEMRQAVNDNLDCDYLIMNAAVADFRPTKINSQKIKKSNTSLSIELSPTVDILGSIKNNTKACLVGFALETDNAERNALSKMKEKKLNYIVLNMPNDLDQGFEVDTNKITVYKNDGQKFSSSVDTKPRIASFLWSAILE